MPSSCRCLYQSRAQIYLFMQDLNLQTSFLLEYAFIYCNVQIIIELVQMEDKILTGQFQKIISRRSRKDEQGRDFQCGCGKRYLSYPALYTHIKTKHQGRQPEGTQKSGNNQMGRRAKARLSQQTLKQLYSLLSKQDLKVIKQLGQAITGRVSLNSRIIKDSPKIIFHSYLALLKTGDIKLSSQQPLQHLLTLFLLILGDFVADKFFEQLLVFARICSDAFNRHGKQVYNAFFHKKDTGPFLLPSFSQNQVKYFPIVAEFIVSSYVPQVCPNDINISLLQLLLFDFCNWLYVMKVSPIKVRLSQAYRLDYKLPSFQRKGDWKRDEMEKQLRQYNEQLSESQSLNEIEQQMIDQQSKKG